MQAFFLNFFFEVAIAVLFVSSFLFIAERARKKFPEFYSPALAYAMFWLANICIFGLAIVLHIQYLPVLLLVLGAWYIFGKFKSIGKQYLWLLLIIPTLFLLWSLPIAEADSIGYHLPKADQAITQNSFSWISTSNSRAAYRFWGIEAQVGNLLLLTNRSTHLLEIVSILSLLVLFLQITELLKGFTKHTKLVGVLACSLPPILLVSLNIKPDIAVIVFLLGIYQQVRYNTFGIFPSLLLYTAIISSKATYTILLPSLFLVLATLPPIKTRLIRLFKEGLLIIWALLLILMLHWKHIIVWWQLPTSFIDKLKGVITGLSPSEVFQVLSDEQIYFWKDVFINFFETQLQRLFFSLSYHDPSYLTTFIIVVIGGIIGLRYQTRLLGFCLLLLISVISLFANPDVSFFRYLQPAYIILACIAGVWLSKSTFGIWIIRILILLSVFSLFNLNVFPKTIVKTIELNRPPFLIEMGIWNTHNLPIPVFTPTHGRILAITNYQGGLSGEFIFTDSKNSAIYHLFPEFLNFESFADLPPHDYILISGTYATDKQEIIDLIEQQSRVIKSKNYQQLEIMPENVRLFRPKN